MTRSWRLLLVAAVTLLWAGVPALRAASVTLTPNNNDVRIGTFDSNSNRLFEDVLSVYNGGAGNDQRSLLQFDLSPIPAGATIDFASLTVWRDSQIWGGGDNGMPTNVWRVTTPWVNNEVTWNQASAGTKWNTPGGGGDFVGTTATDPYASNMLNIVAVNVGPNNSGIFPLFFVVTDLVNEWYSGASPNYGFILESPQGNELTFRADRGPDPQLIPNLTVIFH